MGVGGAKKNRKGLRHAAKFKPRGGGIRREETAKAILNNKGRETQPTGAVWGEKKATDSGHL